MQKLKVRDFFGGVLPLPNGNLQLRSGLDFLRDTSGNVRQFREDGEGNYVEVGTGALNVTGNVIAGHGISAPTYNLEKGIKDDKGKLFYELDFRFIQAMAQRMADNKSGKYPIWNWKRDMNVEDLKQATFRHIIEVMESNYEDDGQALGHIVSLATNAMMIWNRLKYEQDQKELRKKLTEGAQ